MTRIAVLSPHRDDAVFSIGRWMRRWISVGVSVTVWNVYTRTNYGPWLAPGGDVTTGRAFEDKSALRKVASSIETRSASLLDAPLRLQRDVSRVMQQDARAVRPCDVAQVRQLIARVKGDLIIAPLGLGGHIDHLTVREAATETFPETRLGFYEDLPYAAWAEEAQVLECMKAVQRRPLRRRVFSTPLRQNEKLSWTLTYRSQIQREDAILIARHRPEVIWLPRWAAY